MAVRKKYFRAAMVVVSLVLALIVAEGALRGLGYRPRQQNLMQYSREVTMPADGLPYLYKPNSIFALRWPSNPTGYFGTNDSIIFRTNNAGFRGPDFTLARGPKTRVAMLGDSLCFGQGVKEEDMISEALTRELNRLSGGDNFEVFNFCLTSYQTADEVELFTRVVRPYRPDVVVVWFFLNDFFRPGRLEGFGVVGHRNLLAGARERSVVLDSLVTPVDELVTSRVMARAYRESYQAASPEYQAGLATLTRLRKLCAADKIIPVLAIHPILYQLDDRYPFAGVHTLMVEMGNKLNLPVIDMFPWFAGRRDRELWVHPTDWHPNHTAHAIAAEKFAPFLLALLTRNRPYFEPAKAAKIAASAPGATP